MTSEQSRPVKSSKARYIILLGVVILVVAGWSAAWFYGRAMVSEQLDLQLAQASASGLDLTCDERSIAGYPFRYEVRCDQLRSVGRNGSQADLGSLNAVALVYNPWHIILEADAPARFSEPVLGMTGAMAWETARASMRFSSEALGNVSMVLTQPNAEFGNRYSSGTASSAQAEFHLREVPDQSGDVDGFLSVDTLTLDSLPDLPDAFDLRAHVRVKDGAPLLSGVPLPVLVQMNGGSMPVELHLAEVKSEAGRLAVRGNLVLDGNGMISGEANLSLSNPNKVLQTLKPMFSAGNNEFAIAESVLGSLKPTSTDQDGNPAIELPLIIDRGAVRMGFVRLGVIPPLFQAGM